MADDDKRESNNPLSEEQELDNKLNIIFGKKDEAPDVNVKKVASDLKRKKSLSPQKMEDNSTTQDLRKRLASDCDISHDLKRPVTHEGNNRMKLAPIKPNVSTLAKTSMKMLSP